MIIQKPAIEILDQAAHEIIPENAIMEQVATGFNFTEGPVWDGDSLIFSDIPKNRIVKLQFFNRGPEVTTYRTPTGNSNGMTMDLSHRLIICEHSGRRVVMEEEDGSIRVIADRCNGKRFNSPNDVVTRSDGSIYFTDPTFGLRHHTEWKEQGCCGVYRVAPDGEVHCLVDDFQLPNGLAFSPDETKLYIDDTAKHHIRVFDVAEDGSISNGRIFADLRGKEPGEPDGMKVDRKGNVYCTGSGGFWILSPEGKALARINPPEIPANLAWGGRDWRTLYLTARTSIYRMRFNIPGMPVGDFIQTWFNPPPGEW